MTEQELAALNTRCAVEIMQFEEHIEPVDRIDAAGNLYEEDVPLWFLKGSSGFTQVSWKPTTDHNHASMVKKAMRGKGWGWETSSIGNCTYCLFAKIGSDSMDYVRGSITAESEPLAIVQAALSAIEALRGVGG